MNQIHRGRLTDVKVERLFPPQTEAVVEQVAAETAPEPAPAEGLFARDGEDYLPLPLAHGPFDALHGGAIGGLLANAAEALAAREDMGTPIAAHIQFLRPLKSDHRLTVFAEVAQPGRRLNLIDAFIEVDGALRAEGRFTFARDIDIPGLAETPTAPLHDPLSFPVIEPPHRPGRTWFKDALEWREAPGGTVWIRGLTELGPEAHALPRVIAAADWSAGISRPDGWDRPRAAAFPNPALTVNLWRRPIGDWVGLTPKSRWSRAGFGMAEALLSDSHGEIGATSMPVILLPFPEKTAPVA